jgi:hypothetical protein
VAQVVEGELFWPGAGEYPELLPAWYAFRDVRANRRAVEWLADNSLIDDDDASRFLAAHPDPGLP